MPGRILVVDDEAEMLVSLKKILTRQGFTVEGTTEPEAAVAMIGTGAFDLLLTDLKMPGMDGVELLKRVKRIQPDLIVIILTGYARVDTAVAAMKEGAFDYLEKPFSPGQIELVVRRALSHHRLETENLLLRARIEEQFGFDRIVGKSPEMLAVFDLVRKVARSDMNVLVIGESGTGKELIANAIHLNSPRREKPFIPVDCGAIVGTLMESELFGYVKGSFTGANTNKRGLIEMADGGTLFLDELGELSPSLQVKLLRTLQERKFRPVGGSHFISVDIRIVGATNRNLREAVKAGTFREDLYHRLNVIQIDLPPLRRRTGDIPVLAAHFLREAVRASGKPVRRITDAAMACLCRYPWPGNVRELKNIIDRAVFLTEGDAIGLRDLPDHVREPTHPGHSLSSPSNAPPSIPIPSVGRGGEIPFKEAKQQWIERFERDYLVTLLQRYDCNITQAAQAAGIDRKSIQRMMKRYALSIVCGPEGKRLVTGAEGERHE